MNGPTTDTGFICMGHRGAAGHEPENTLRSIERAIALGAAWIEIDVHCVEGVPVVIHDNRLDRTTSGTGLLARRSMAYVRSVDAGRGERVPLLTEVMDLIGERAGLNIELKGKRTAAPVVRIAGQFVRGRGWSYDRLLLSSFDHSQLAEARRLDPALAVAPLFRPRARSVLARALKLGAWSVNVPLPLVDSRLVSGAHARGLRVLVWTVDRPADIARMAALGVDGVITDYPERAAAMRRGAGPSADPAHPRSGRAG